MNETYDDPEARGFASGEGLDEASRSAADVFKGLLEEMGIDPLDRGEWLVRFIERHRAHLSRGGNGDLAFGGE